MAKILRRLMLALFAGKQNRPAKKAAAGTDRAHLIRQALATRREKEHLWDELSDREKEELMASLGDGLSSKIAAMQARDKQAG